MIYKIFSFFKRVDKVMRSFISLVTLFIVFFLFITPLALIFKLIRKDSLKIKRDKTVISYKQEILKDDHIKRMIYPF
jgi:hypothetical protein